MIGRKALRPALAAAAVPAVAAAGERCARVEASSGASLREWSGFNAGGRLAYRFGRSRRFGAGRRVYF